MTQNLVTVLGFQCTTKERLTKMTVLDFKLVQLSQKCSESKVYQYCNEVFLLFLFVRVALQNCHDNLGFYQGC